MKILVCGGRDYNDWDEFVMQMHVVAQLNGSITHIISGGARGADFLAKVYAQTCNLNYDEYPADWDKHGRMAGPVRNQKMLDYGRPDHVVAFPGGRGTADMVRRAKQQGFKVTECL